MHLTPELLIRAYALGIFPMAERRDADTVHWIDPELRGILPLEGFHLPRKLARRVRRGDYAVTADADFPAVIRGCAEPGPRRPETWINDTIEGLYCELHRMGCAHSIEVWGTEGGERRLVGGLYGVSLGAAFFGESMFSRAVDASKVALVHLVVRLRLGGFRLLDTQFTTSHLRQFGALEVPREHYKALLAGALQQSARFPADVDPAALDAALATLRESSF